MSKFANTFYSPYEEQREFNGLSFEVLGEVDKTTYVYEETGVMYNIKLSNGVEIQALPEEIEVEIRKMNNFPA